MGTAYKPRLAIEILPEQQAILTKMLDHGLRKAIFSALIDDLIAAYQRMGINALTGILDKPSS